MPEPPCQAFEKVLAFRHLHGIAVSSFGVLRPLAFLVTAKCTYCDFFFQFLSAPDRQDGWVDGIVRELDGSLPTNDRPVVVDHLLWRRHNRSLMNGKIDRADFGHIASLSADGQTRKLPGKQSRQRRCSRFGRLPRRRVNRVSLGVQALNDTDLKKLGRLHDTAEAKAGSEIGDGCFSNSGFHWI